MVNETFPHIVLTVTDQVAGYTYLRDYQNDNNHTIYMVPTYVMTVSGGNYPDSRYEVIRFGVADLYRQDSTDEEQQLRVRQGFFYPKVTDGLSSGQYFTQWDFNYGLHSNRRAEKKGLRILLDPVNKFSEENDTLIHAGPANPRVKPDFNLDDSWGAANCIEVVGPNQWVNLYEEIQKRSRYYPTKSIDRNLGRLAGENRLKVVIEPSDPPSR